MGGVSGITLSFGYKSCLLLLNRSRGNYLALLKQSLNQQNLKTAL